MNSAHQNTQRQFAVLNEMFKDLNTTSESNFNDAARKRLKRKALLINQCPHWCEDVEVLCECLINGKTAAECTVMGVKSGDFPYPQAK